MYNNTYYSVEPYTGEILCHFGLLGMKWGKRRWQYPDGRFNEEGKKRYFEKKSDGKDNDYEKKSNPILDKAKTGLKVAAAVGAIATAPLWVGPVVAANAIQNKLGNNKIEKTYFNKNGTLNGKGRDVMYDGDKKTRKKVLDKLIGNTYTQMDEKDEGSVDYIRDILVKDYGRGFASKNEMLTARNKVLDKVLNKIDGSKFKDYNPNTSDDYKYLNFILGGIANTFDPDGEYITYSDFYTGPNPEERYSRY